VATARDGLSVLLALPFRPGGARSWGLGLRDALAPEARVRLVARPGDLPRLLAPRCDIVHTALPFVRSWRRPVVATVHGDFRRESRLYRRGYESLLRRADALTVPSVFLRDRLGVDAQVVPNGVADQGLRWRVREGPGLRVLVASKFAFAEKTRGTVEAVEELAALRPRFPGLEVDVAGDGAFSGQVEDAVRKAGPGFRFLGWRDDLPARMAQADVLVYRSHLDNQPLLVIQAMLAGLPVLANPVGDLPNMLPPEALADAGGPFEDALRRLGDPRQRAALSREQRRRAESTYLWDALKPRWLALYRGLLA
jgi:glycosyltransferase involved in cell wall biosynthesis